MKMKWTVRDVGAYFAERDYVDTAVVPLVKITWHNEIKATVEQGEFTTLMADRLEGQLKGRLMLFPPFTYLKSEDVANRLKRLQSWMEMLRRDGMKHVFLITSDAEWKTVESDLDESLIWIPSLPLEHMDPEHGDEMIANQTKQLLQIVTAKWQNA
ncbi:MAG TPA: YpiF family protein [Bacillales bacterium]|nr:YpiF family protein [Bacillales bacterium]